MKKGRKLIVLLTILSLFVTCCLVGCGNKQSEPASTPQEPETLTIVDMAGREVTVPAAINKAFPTSPLGTVFIYTLDPELLIGWNNELRQGDDKFVPSKYLDLPHLGGWYAKTTCNTEELLKINPDVIISMGSIDEMNISQADKIQQQIGIPVIMISSNLNELDKSYKLAGKLLNLENRANKLGAYCRESINDVKAKSQSIAQEQRVTVYYAEGPNGLETEPSGIHTRLIDMVGGVNIADVPMQSGKGLTPVSLEQVLNWNPDVILSWNEGQGGYYKNIRTDSKWATISAVKAGKVYAIPGGPFNWFERPPSVNQILGLKWLGNLLYPEVYNYDMGKETKEFYKLFYHYDLSDEELTILLKDSGGK